MNRKVIGMTGALAGLWVAATPVHAGQLVTPGTVIFDMDTHTEFCDPDYWSFFGTPTVDFGSNGADSEDGTAVFTTGNWTVCDGIYGSSACTFLGAKHGDGRIGPPGQPLCGGLGSGVRDADHDLSLGTGITMRIRLILIDGGKPGVRAHFQLTDSNGLPIKDTDTVAVIPRSIPGKPWINRTPPLADDDAWHTYTFWFDGLDRAYDNAAIAGTDPLDYTDITGYKLVFRRGPTSELTNKIVFDQITLIDDPPVLWADDDGDGDVDLEDWSAFQGCFGKDPIANPECARWDANYDTVIDEDPFNADDNDVINYNDLRNFQECLEGPGVTTGFFPWCY